jgi:hypothetical protein
LHGAIERSKAERMGRRLKGLTATLCGVATTALTAAGLVCLELRCGCAIYGFVYGLGLTPGADCFVECEARCRA